MLLLAVPPTEASKREQNVNGQRFACRNNWRDKFRSQAKTNVAGRRGRPSNSADVNRVAGSETGRCDPPSSQDPVILGLLNVLLKARRCRNVRPLELTRTNTMTLAESLKTLTGAHRIEQSLKAQRRPRV